MIECKEQIIKELSQNFQSSVEVDSVNILENSFFVENISPKHSLTSDIQEWQNIVSPANNLSQSTVSNFDANDQTFLDTICSNLVQDDSKSFSEKSSVRKENKIASKILTLSLSLKNASIRERKLRRDIVEYKKRIELKNKGIRKWQKRCQRLEKSIN